MEDVPVQKSDIVTGQHPPVLQEQAREFRREMTPAEKLLWEAVRDSKLGDLHFRPQPVIADFIVDFYCHAAGLVVEVDGEIHEKQVERDPDRDGLPPARGLLIRRFSNRRVMNGMRAVLEEIQAAALDRRRAHSPDDQQLDAE
jgi:very-short-patch-repair endonuclease